MSYTRSYRETVYQRVSKNVSYNYPASERGGSGSMYVELEAEIPVEVNIHVDTNPFDRSVENCSSHVDLLTGAVVATETAEIASRTRTSKKVASTIVGGFFSYIRSEISQQISELTQSTDAQSMHLKELMQTCISKKKQMESDYIRISSRYVKIFDDLNGELSNRIYELDKPAFVFKKETDSQKIRTSDNDLVNTVAIFGSESSDLQTKIGASITKKRALDTLNKAKMFLWQQKKLNNTIQQSMHNESVAGSIFTPVCFVESNNTNNQIDRNVHNTSFFSELNEKSAKNSLMEHFSSKAIKWTKLTPTDAKNISLYFNTELNNEFSESDQHAMRVREMIQKIVNISSIEAINFQQI
ncbi:MAG TPA: hypothetical protein VIK55_09750 [Paludibacter sp.]